MYMPTMLDKDLVVFTCFYPRRDRYNKKLERFHVVFEEGDTDLSDFEETEKHEEVQARTLGSAASFMSSFCPAVTTSRNEQESVV